MMIPRWLNWTDLLCFRQLQSEQRSLLLHNFRFRFWRKNRRKRNERFAWVFDPNWSSSRSRGDDWPKILRQREWFWLADLDRRWILQLEILIFFLTLFHKKNGKIYVLHLGKKGNFISCEYWQAMNFWELFNCLQFFFLQSANSLSEYVPSEGVSDWE